VDDILRFIAEITVNIEGVDDVCSFYYSQVSVLIFDVLHKCPGISHFHSPRKSCFHVALVPLISKDMAMSTMVPHVIHFTHRGAPKECAISLDPQNSQGPKVARTCFWLHASASLIMGEEEPIFETAIQQTKLLLQQRISL